MICPISPPRTLGAASAARDRRGRPWGSRRVSGRLAGRALQPARRRCFIRVYRSGRPSLRDLAAAANHPPRGRARARRRRNRPPGRRAPSATSPPTPPSTASSASRQLRESSTLELNDPQEYVARFAAAMRADIASAGRGAAGARLHQPHSSAAARTALGLLLLGVEEPGDRSQRAAQLPARAAVRMANRLGMDVGRARRPRHLLARRSEIAVTACRIGLTTCRCGRRAARGACADTLRAAAPALLGRRPGRRLHHPEVAHLQPLAGPPRLRAPPACAAWPHRRRPGLFSWTCYYRGGMSQGGQHVAAQGDHRRAGAVGLPRPCHAGPARARRPARRRRPPDIRAAIGEALAGGPVVYPTTNPSPPPSPFRKRRSHVAAFVEVLARRRDPQRLRCVRRGMFSKTCPKSASPILTFARAGPALILPVTAGSALPHPASFEQPLAPRLPFEQAPPHLHLRAVISACPPSRLAPTLLGTFFERRRVLRACPCARARARGAYLPLTDSFLDLPRSSSSVGAPASRGRGGQGYLDLTSSETAPTLRRNQPSSAGHAERLERDDSRRSASGQRACRTSSRRTPAPGLRACGGRNGLMRTAVR